MIDLIFLIFIIPAVILCLDRYIHENAHYFLLQRYGIKADKPKFNFLSLREGGYVKVIDENAYQNLNWKKKINVSIAGFVTDLLIHLMAFLIYYLNFGLNFIGIGIVFSAIFSFIGTLFGNDRKEFLKALKEQEN